MAHLEIAVFGTRAARGTQSSTVNKGKAVRGSMAFQQRVCFQSSSLTHGYNSLLCHGSNHMIHPRLLRKQERVFNSHVMFICSPIGCRSLSLPQFFITTHQHRWDLLLPPQVLDATSNSFTRYLPRIWQPFSCVSVPTAEHASSLLPTS